MISIIHPSKGRPEKSFTTMSKWLERAGFPVELIVIIDQDEQHSERYHSAYEVLKKNHARHSIRIVSATSKTAIEAINIGAGLAKGDIFIVASDDTDCPWNWAGKIETIASGKKDFVIQFDDGLQTKVITMPVLDRTYYNRFGYIYYPGYQHLWCDKEFATMAYKLKKVIKSDIKFPHLQYSIIGEQPDAVNLKNNATNEQGRKLYFSRLKQKFPR